jgi:Concanavalin A-like lectin/glucanases superfamily
MSLTSMQEAELRELLEAMCEERATPDQLRRLETMVLADPQAEELYITFMTLQATLRCKFRGVPLARPVDALDAGIRLEGSRVRRHPLRLGWTLATAACLAAAVTLGLSLRGRLGGGPSSDRRPVPSADLAAGPAMGASGLLWKGVEPLAVVVQTDDARWEQAEGPTPVRGHTVGPGRFRLASGTTTFAFLNGVMLTLEGPADIDLISVERVFCRRGKLRTRVPKGAEGFIVASPSSAVVDLGTEFALNLEDDGHAQVMVFEGVAETALLGLGGVPKLTQTVNRSEAFDLDPESGRIAASSAKPERFVAAPSISAGPLSLDPGYPGAVLAARPRSYWRFESTEGGEVKNEVPGGPPLRVNGPVAVASGDSGNGCATFIPGAPEQFLTADTLFDLTTEPGHAVEFWFQADRYLHASLVGFIPPKEFLEPGNRDPYVHTLLVELTAQQRQTLNKPASVRFLHRWPIDYRLGNNLFSERNYVPWAWHHVVAQRTGDRMELFFDGAAESAVPLEAAHPKLACRLVVGRRVPLATEKSDARPFVGRLDELAVYDHALSGAQVRSHFLLAKPNHSLE